jgi:hypothetical protein
MNYTYAERLEVPMAVKMPVLVFWVVALYELVGRYQLFTPPSSGLKYFSPADGDSIFLRCIGIYLQVHTQQPRRLTSNYTFFWGQQEEQRATTAADALYEGHYTIKQIVLVCYL